MSYHWKSKPFVDRSSWEFAIWVAKIDRKNGQKQAFLTSPRLSFTSDSFFNRIRQTNTFSGSYFKAKDNGALRLIISASFCRHTGRNLPNSEKTRYPKKCIFRPFQPKIWPSAGYFLLHCVRREILVWNVPLHPIFTLCLRASVRRTALRTVLQPTSFYPNIGEIIFLWDIFFRRVLYKPTYIHFRRQKQTKNDFENFDYFWKIV